jgi:hypothetical protein
MGLPDRGQCGLDVRVHDPTGKRAPTRACSSAAAGGSGAIASAARNTASDGRPGARQPRRRATGAAARDIRR